jgi:hypothetical protein
MTRFGLLVLVGAAFLGYLTYTEGTLAFQSSAQPEQISLQDLIARGPEGNGHVLLTQFVLCADMVQQTEGKKSEWTGVWIPIIPIEEADPRAADPPTPRNIKALIFSTNIRNEAGIRNRLAKPQVQALVTNRISSLADDTRKLLRQRYPQTDFDRCLIIQEGRQPFSRGIVFFLGGGTFVALCLGIYLLLAARRGSQ